MAVNMIEGEFCIFPQQTSIQKIKPVIYCKCCIGKFCFVNMEFKQHSEAKIYIVLWQRRGIIVYKHVLVQRKEENSEYNFLSQSSEAVRQRKIETGNYILIKSEALAEDFTIFEQNEKGIEEDPFDLVS